MARGRLNLVLDSKHWNRLYGYAWYIFNRVAIQRAASRPVVVYTAGDRLHIVDSYSKHLSEGLLELRVHDTVYEGVGEAAAEYEVVSK